MAALLAFIRITMNFCMYFMCLFVLPADLKEE